MRLKFIRRLEFLCILAIGLCYLIVYADRHDREPKLDDLFAALSKTTQEYQAKQIEQLIWSFWFMSGDDEVDAIMQKLSQSRRLQDFEVALEYSNEIIKLKPDYAEGWNQRATMEFLLGNYENSLADIVETLKREPRHFGALSGRAFILLKQNKNRQAIETINQALKIHPFLGLRDIIPNVQKSEVL